MQINSVTYLITSLKLYLSGLRIQEKYKRAQSVTQDLGQN